MCAQCGNDPVKQMLVEVKNKTNKKQKKKFKPPYKINGMFKSQRLYLRILVFQPFPSSREASSACEGQLL